MAEPCREIAGGWVPDTSKPLDPRIGEYYTLFRWARISCFNCGRDFFINTVGRDPFTHRICPDNCPLCGGPMDRRPEVKYEDGVLFLGAAVNALARGYYDLEETDRAMTDFVQGLMYTAEELRGER